jgi:hypothetical protein
LVASDDRPKNLPIRPNAAYKNAGWIGWTDFLSLGGSKNIELEKAEEKENSKDIEI